MHNRFTNLQSIIAFFFGALSIILLSGYFISTDLHHTINLYTGLAFLAFSVFLFLTPGESTNE